MSQPENPFYVNEEDEERAWNNAEQAKIVLGSQPVTKADLEKRFSDELNELDRKRVGRCIGRLWMIFWFVVGLAVLFIGGIAITDYYTKQLLVSFDYSVHNVSLNVLNHEDHVHRELVFGLHFKMKSQSKTCRNVDMHVTMNAYHRRLWLVGAIFTGIVGVFDQGKSLKLHNHISLGDATDIDDTDLEIRCIVKCTGHYNAIKSFTFRTPKWPTHVVGLVDDD